MIGSYLKHAIYLCVSAKFEIFYIFCWMDWDGDNILAMAELLIWLSKTVWDVLMQYRFDDDDRWSTSIKEQKLKSKYTVQSFAQIADYLKREARKKKILNSFRTRKRQMILIKYFYKEKNIIFFGN